MMGASVSRRVTQRLPPPSTGRHVAGVMFVVVAPVGTPPVTSGPAPTAALRPESQRRVGGGAGPAAAPECHGATSAGGVKYQPLAPSSGTPICSDFELLSCTYSCSRVCHSRGCPPATLGPVTARALLCCCCCCYCGDDLPRKAWASSSCFYLCIKLIIHPAPAILHPGCAAL